MPTVTKNVNALARVIKNSVRLTEPTVYFGLLPFEIRVLVTIGPQPPPPNESRKPPTPASQPTLFTFLLFVCCWNALNNIFRPRNIAYNAITGISHLPPFSP